MPDDKTKCGQPDRAKINKNEPYEVGYEARKLGTSAAKIHEAITEVGNNRKAMEKYVKGGQQKK